MSPPSNDNPPTGADRYRQATGAQPVGGGIGGPDDPEQVLWEGGFSGKAMIGYWIFAVLVTAGAVAAVVFFPPALIGAAPAAG